MKPLVVFDLNGVLIKKCHTSERAISCKELDLKNTSLGDNIDNIVEYDTFSDEKYVFYLRPYLKLFFEHIFKLYNVGIFTSTKEYNAKFIVSQIFTLEQQQKLVFKWFRDRAAFDPDFGVDPSIKDYDTIKRIDSILNCPTINENRFYTRKNVIIIDDSLQKMRFNGKNYIVVPTFELNEYGYSEYDSILFNLLYAISIKFKELNC